MSNLFIFALLLSVAYLVFRTRNIITITAFCVFIALAKCTMTPLNPSYDLLRYEQRIEAQNLQHYLDTVPLFERTNDGINLARQGIYLPSPSKLKETL